MRATPRPFSTAELRTLRRMVAAGATFAQMAQALGRGRKTVHNKLVAMGLGDQVHRLIAKTRWTAEMDAELRRRYPDDVAQDIAHALGVSLSALYQRAQRLRLTKSEAFFASDKAARIQRGCTDPRMAATRFQKGMATHNKGRPQSEWMPPESAAKCSRTQFKVGRPAHEARNYVPVGTEKIDSTRGALVRKITDDPAIVPSMRWRPVHVLVWEAAYGPIPAGRICIFRPGLKTLVASEITPDRLELVTPAENMRRNSYQTRYPKDVALAIQARGALTRVINRITRSTP